MLVCLCVAVTSAKSTSAADTRRAIQTSSNAQRPKSPTTAGQLAPKRARDSDDDQQHQKGSTSAPTNGAEGSSPGDHEQKKRKVADVASGVKRKRVTWPADDKLANIRHFTKGEKEDSKHTSAVDQVS